MFYRSHKWVMQPYTAYEIRREMQVRESRQTVMIFNRKYQNIDTGKFDTDKLATFYRESLSEIIEDNYGNNKYASEYRPRSSHRNKRSKKSLPDFIPKFVPKDNDFDKEIREEKERLDKEQYNYEKQVKESEERASVYFETQNVKKSNIICNVISNKWVIKSY